MWTRGNMVGHSRKGSILSFRKGNKGRDGEKDSIPSFRKGNKGNTTKINRTIGILAFRKTERREEKKKRPSDRGKGRGCNKRIACGALAGCSKNTNKRAAGNHSILLSTKGSKVGRKTRNNVQSICSVISVAAHAYLPLWSWGHYEDIFPWALKVL